MKKGKKSMLILFSALMLVAASVFGTIAYLTDTDEVNNTFTVGKVTLGDESEKGLDEALVNEAGSPVDAKGNVVDRTDAPRVQNNIYKLVPGHTYVKDPTVHVKNDSEDSYIFVKINNGIEAIEANTNDDYKKISDQILENGWQPLEDKDGEGVANIYWRKWTKPEAETDGTTDYIVFSEFKIDGADTDATDLVNYVTKKIDITAYAIQADGFDTAFAAWTAGDFLNSSN